MSGPPPQQEIDDFCALHRLRVIERLPATGGSRFIARVADGAGQQLFLKRSSGLRGHGEIPVLRAWEGLDATPRHLRAIDPETFTCEWISGVTLDRSELPVGDLLRRAGTLLRELHSATPPAGLITISERASPEWVARDIASALPEKMVAAAHLAAAGLRTHTPAESVLLHGDFVPGNILLSGERMVVVDPIGFVGPASWDVAQLSIAVSGRDRRENLANVLAGYGSAPRLLDDAFAYLAFLFFGKALEQATTPAGNHPLPFQELRALAESLC